MRMLGRSWLAIVLAAGIVSEAVGGASDFGTTGLIKLPTARMDSDGTLRATIALDEVANIYNISFQALPRVQGTVRYTIFNPNSISGSRDPLRDRSYEIKALVLKETRLLPDVSIGGRDVLGSGAWEAEYLVASKSWKRFDATFGLGWGRLGSRSGFPNPLRFISERFDDRLFVRQSGGEYGGDSRGASFFRGDAAFFGGLTYSLATAPITLVAEYESDQYDREVDLGSLDRPSAFNVGLLWRSSTGLSLRASWLRGDTLGLTFSSQVKTKAKGPKKLVRLSSPTDVEIVNRYNSKAWYDRMLVNAEQSGLFLKRGNLEDGDKKASLVIENREYNLTADAISHVALMSEYLMPEHVSNVDILLEEDGLSGPTVNYSLQREITKSQSQYLGYSRDPIEIFAPRVLSKPTNATDYGYPSLGFALDLAARVQLMDPDDPARKQVYAKLTGRLQFSDNWNVWMRYEQDVYNDFSSSRASFSGLSRVRIDVNRYLVEGKSGVDQLYLEYKKSLSPTLHSRFYAGILELMYGGIGSEILYSPYKQRWALGFNINSVKQRGFQRNFEFRDYGTTTAHVSAYYALPFYNIDMAVHVGRYLAKDRGYTFEARRTFDSGFSLGGFFTRTNVSAEEYGEGGFDKGLFFRIPFNGFLPGNTRASYSTILRSLERDGGRRLEGFGGNLWFDRRTLRFDVLDRNRYRMRP